jgi:hypothetical protein
VATCVPLRCVARRSGSHPDVRTDPCRGRPDTRQRRLGHGDEPRCCSRRSTRQQHHHRHRIGDRQLFGGARPPRPVHHSPFHRRCHRIRPDLGDRRGDTSSVTAATASGAEAVSFPTFASGWALVAPATGDLLSNGHVDLVVTTSEGNLWAWATPGHTTADTQRWSRRHARDPWQIRGRQSTLTPHGGGAGWWPPTAGYSPSGMPPSTAQQVAVLWWHGSSVEPAPRRPVGRRESTGAGQLADHPNHHKEL